MLRVGLEPTIPAFEQTKAVHTLYRTATVIDNSLPLDHNILKIYARFGVHIGGEIRKHVQCNQNQGNSTTVLRSALFFLLSSILNSSFAHAYV
jgi:hypothetical protein